MKLNKKDISKFKPSNLAIGWRALEKATPGSSNIAIGPQALQELTIPSFSYPSFSRISKKLCKKILDDPNGRFIITKTPIPKRDRYYITVEFEIDSLLLFEASKNNLSLPQLIIYLLREILKRR